MENINDIRRLEGSPYAGSPNTGPRPLSSPFRTKRRALRLVYALLTFFGIIFTELGIVTYIVPITVVSILVTIFGLIMFITSRPRPHPKHAA